VNNSSCPVHHHLSRIHPHYFVLKFLIPFNFESKWNFRNYVGAFFCIWYLSTLWDYGYEDETISSASHGEILKMIDRY
jgi:hypothetical protein